MGFGGVLPSLPRIAALVLALGLGATTPYIYFAILHRSIHDSVVAIRAATAPHDAPVELFPTHRPEMGDRPDCW